MTYLWGQTKKAYAQGTLRHAAAAAAFRKGRIQTCSIAITEINGHAEPSVTRLANGCICAPAPPTESPSLSSADQKTRSPSKPATEKEEEDGETAVMGPEDCQREKKEVTFPPYSPAPALGSPSLYLNASRPTSSIVLGKERWPSHSKEGSSHANGRIVPGRCDVSPPLRRPHITEAICQQNQPESRN